MRDTPANSGSVRQKTASTGFVTLPVTSLSSAVEAWKLTYNWLRRKDLIPPNRHRIHTYPQAATENALVVTGWIGPLPVSTLTAIRDSELGLPLDRSFADEINAMRNKGRRVIEISLFGDRRREMSRSTDSLLWLMRIIWSWGRLHDVDDFLIAVPPPLRKYYETGFGFAPIGASRAYAHVSGRLAQLMRCDLVHWRKHKSPPPAVQFLANHLEDESTFQDRYQFPKGDVTHSVIGEYLKQCDADLAA